jgi:hypothetical protein
VIRYVNEADMFGVVNSFFHLMIYPIGLLRILIMSLVLFPKLLNPMLG